MSKPDDIFFRIDVSAIDADRLCAFAERYTPRQLKPAREVGSGSNLTSVAALGRRDGEAVVRLPIGPISTAFEAEFTDAIVPFPGRADDAEELAAWHEANRMEAHAITLPVGNGMRTIYERTAAKMMALVARVERDEDPKPC